MSEDEDAFRPKERHPQEEARERAERNTYGGGSTVERPATPSLAAHRFLTFILTKSP